LIYAQKTSPKYGNNPEGLSNILWFKIPTTTYSVIALLYVTALNIIGLGFVQNSNDAKTLPNKGEKSFMKMYGLNF